MSTFVKEEIVSEKFVSKRDFKGVGKKFVKKFCVKFMCKIYV